MALIDDSAKLFILWLGKINVTRSKAIRALVLMDNNTAVPPCFDQYLWLECGLACLLILDKVIHFHLRRCTGDACLNLMALINDSAKLFILWLGKLNGTQSKATRALVLMGKTVVKRHVI